MAARFKMKRQGVGQMLRMPGMQAEMLRRADSIRDVAVALSPVDDGSPTPGHYKASWETDSKARGGRRRDRAVAVVRNTAYYARWVEYGTERVPAHHVLLRAAHLGGGD
ncbi:HK97 gp10 family phage protein [Streptomyces sp. NBC_01239]|uniref:HK97 gp10 family phage protein n=1 Tax=Streptomyces sp. NBC_01239 TaxID=2903792 RepID=UPI002250E014|nr:HK97 gp10 family phage protein [Streptomyces sp. NBC_01239]MCX4816774.1 HK97 gp10 family phage protein [Streptomyces sp. NBC_01239]MCX4818222.1 HK97 gp10 family phage protein [Streptomyces sp. NBC_01239]